MSEDLKRIKLEEIRLLEQEILIKKTLPHRYAWKNYTWAQKFLDCTNKENFLTAANQASKALYIEELIPTPSGFKKMKDIVIGDIVFSRYGEPIKVIDIPFIGTEISYKITFNDSSHVICGENHLWISKGYNERFRKGYKSREKRWSNPNYGKWNVYSTKDIVKNYSPAASATKRFSIPVSSEVKLKEKDLFDPYYVGMYLGNGSDHALSFNKEDTDMSEYAQKYGNEYNVSRNDLVVGILQKTRVKLIELGLIKPSFQKEIPEEYLFGSIKQRKLLLAGLLDTDGTYGKEGRQTSFSSTSKKLAYQVRQLVCSLGGIAEVKKRKAGYKKDGIYIRCKDCYNVTIWTEFNPFKSKRKSSLWRINDRYKHERVITKIECVGEAPVKCITVSSDDGSFLCTKGFVVTHNSTTQIRKFIDWSTDQSKWPSLWHGKPDQFWYLYPNRDTATVEFNKKWLPLMPKEFDPELWKKYGWEEDRDRKNIKAVHFFSGVSIYFKTYSQDVHDLQSGTVYYVGFDEELPVDLLGELQSRLNSTDGYLSGVFTATLGQDYWRRVMEPRFKDEELHVDAFKQTVSLFDCLKYQDGTNSHWTRERINRIIRRCADQKEIDVRVYGKFAKLGGRLFSSYDEIKNRSKNHPLPKDWHIYTGVDIGSGTSDKESGITSKKKAKNQAHPAAIILLAVDPTFRKGRVFKAWRGDDVRTTSSDILVKYVEMRGNLTPVLQSYDWESAEFKMIAENAGEHFEPAYKKKNFGIPLLNSLFKNEMLSVQDGDPELDKLSAELVSLSEGCTTGDDLASALRYAASKVPWDFSWIDGLPQPEVIPKKELTEEERRRGIKDEDDRAFGIEDEFEEWNSLYEV